MIGFEKQRNILDYALSSLWRRKNKNITIILVFSLVIFLLASFQFLTGSLTKTAEKILTTSPEIIVQKMVAGRQESIPLAYSNKLKKIFGIRNVSPRIWGYYFDVNHKANYTVIGVDSEVFHGESFFTSKKNIEVNSFHLQKGEVILGQAVHKLLGLNDRKHFSFFRPDLSIKPLKVAAIFSPQNNILTADMVIMNLEDARDLFQITRDMASDLRITVTNPAEIKTIAKKISASLPDTRVLSRDQIQKTYQVVFGWRGGFGSLLLLTSLFAFVILAWDKASGLSPEEKREISILKILGWETADILSTRFWEGMLLAGISFVIGVSLAYLHVLFFEASLFKPMLLGWSVTRPAIQFIPSITLADTMLLICFTIIPYMAATVIPAWRCAVVPPDAAIR